MSNINSHRKDKNLILQTLVDEASATITYVWKSEVWKSKDEEVWEIMRIKEDWTTTEVALADWSADFKFAWSNRAIYDYIIN